MENRCPICKVHPKFRGTHQPSLARDKSETISMLVARENGQNDADFQQKFKDLGLRPVFPPFWARLPHTNIFQAFTPDLLHQLHKGVFKDHLVKWCTGLIGEKELDERFRAMTMHPGLHHFKNGISSVSQWTEAEHKEMEKVFVGILASADIDQHVIKAVRSIVDFVYYALLHSHTTSTLASLQQSLDNFHANKEVFIELEARSPGHFNIPKIHAMEHYYALIVRFGSADGYNSESPERLHIDYAKDAYRATNKKDYTYQMTIWLERQEAVDQFQTYLDWCRRGGLSTHHSAQVATLADHSEPPESDADDTENAVVVEETSPSSSIAKPSLSYKVAKNHPRALRNVPAATIISDHNAARFLEALQTFLTHHGSSITPRWYDSFDLWKRLELHLPAIPEAGVTKLKNIVRASPPVSPSGRCIGEPAHLDFALIRTGEANGRTDGTALQGESSKYKSFLLTSTDLPTCQQAFALATSVLSSSFPMSTAFAQHIPSHTLSGLLLSVLKLTCPLNCTLSLVQRACTMFMQKSLR